MSKSLVEISSKEQFDKTLKGSKIVVADCETTCPSIRRAKSHGQFSVGRPSAAVAARRIVR